jgi:hypothetical protein
MSKFIELTVSEEEETKTELINMANVGRVYPVLKIHGAV